ncbi:MAG TPA: class I SAM-dependent methyltransferase [Pyrinomonadaceae bacterium]|nr:class I SAM-dependent methyltransferase [Pyrinomonadaceae bacterium]
MTSAPPLAPPRFIERPEDCIFYHTMELPGLGVVEGLWDLRGRFEDYVGGVEVSGKTVLDVGTATGFLSFEAERRGASRVVSHDMSDARQQKFLPFRDNLYHRDYETFLYYHRQTVERWQNGYWLCHRLLGSRAEVFYGDVYDLPPALGPFDVSIVGAVLEHLPDQVSALASIARLTRGSMVLVTPLLDSEDRVAHFEPRADNPGQDYTWWTYSVGLYREVLAILGFRVERVTRAVYHRNGGADEERTTLVAARV